MAVTSKELYAGTLTTTLTATLYTVPSSTNTVVTSITICNSSGSSANLTLKAGGTALFAALPVDAGTSLFLGPNDIRKVLATTKTIAGGASAGSALEVTINGVELT